MSVSKAVRLCGADDGCGRQRSTSASWGGAAVDRQGVIGPDLGCSRARSFFFELSFFEACSASAFTLLLPVNMQSAGPSSTNHVTMVDGTSHDMTSRD